MSPQIRMSRSDRKPKPSSEQLLLFSAAATEVHETFASLEHRDAQWVKRPTDAYTAGVGAGVADQGRKGDRRTSGSAPWKGTLARLRGRRKHREPSVHIF